MPIDVEYLSELPAHPSLADLCLAYECYQELAQGKSHVIEAIHRLGLQKDTAYRRLREVERILLGKPGSLINKKPGKGISKAVADEELIRRIEDILQAYQGLRKSLSERVRIRLGATNICLLRFVPEVIRQLRQDAEILGDVSFRFEQEEWRPLVDKLKSGELDLVVTSCEQKFAARGVKVISEVQLPRCVIYPMEHRFNQEGNDWDREFANADTRDMAWQRLRDETLIVLDKDWTEPDLPWKEIPGYDNHDNQRVATYAEVHAHVLAGGGIGFTHQECLSEDEEQHLTVVDVSAKLGTSRLCALLSTASKADKKIMKRVCHGIEEYFKAMSGRVSRRDDEFAHLRRYRFLWHTTTGKKEEVPMWVPGSVRLQTTPAGCIKGSEGSDVHQQRIFRIFGYVLDGHMIWRGISQGAETHRRGLKQKGAERFIDHYAIDFYLGDKKGQPLVGTWIGKDYAQRRRSGVAVLHTERIATPQQLIDIVHASGIRHVDTSKAMRIARAGDI